MESVNALRLAKATRQVDGSMPSQMSTTFTTCPDRHHVVASDGAFSPVSPRLLESGPSLQPDGWTIVFNANRRATLTTFWKIGLAVLLTTISVSSAEAGAITCLPMDQRVATLSDASECRTQSGANLNSGADLNTLFGVNYTWALEGVLSMAPGANDLFTVTSGAWGGMHVTGQWFIDPSFWT